jgi:FKBP-type peptidyl-prolyl cis-trans isomerase (trigger factor)
MFKKAARSAPDNEKIQITDTAPCEKSLRVTLGPDAVEPVRTEVLAEFQKAAALPGFRKGKAPAEMVRQQYAQGIEDETLQRVTRRTLEETAKAHQLKPVGPFEVSQAQFSHEGGLTLEAKVEVEPAFPLGAYKGIPLTRGSIEVSPDAVDKALAKLQDSMAQLVPAKEGGGQKERQVPVLDDELAKDLGHETLPKLRAHVEAKLREQMQAARDEALESALCGELLKRHPFQVPAKLVGHQTDRLTREFKARLLLSGMTEEQVGAEVAKFTEQLRTNAERRVKLSFVLDRIAEEEKIGVTQDELVKRLWELSHRWKKDPADVRKMFDAEGLWPSVVSSIRQEKTIAMLLSAAAVQGGQPAAATSQPVPTLSSSHQGGKKA